MQTEIAERMDTVLLGQILQHGAFDANSLTDIVEYILKKVTSHNEETVAIVIACICVVPAGLTAGESCPRRADEDMEREKRCGAPNTHQPRYLMFFVSLCCRRWF